MRFLRNTTRNDPNLHKRPFDSRLWTYCAPLTVLWAVVLFTICREVWDTSNLDIGEVWVLNRVIISRSIFCNHLAKCPPNPMWVINFHLDLVCKPLTSYCLGPFLARALGAAFKVGQKIALRHGSKRMSGATNSGQLWQHNLVGKNKGGFRFALTMARTYEAN